jgi:hypothetical protein
MMYKNRSGHLMEYWRNYKIKKKVKNNGGK